jgi:hypothetical protein
VASDVEVALSARDREVVELVGRFRQLATHHIRTTLFAELSSPTPCDRTLKRLVERRYLGRLRRLVGGDHGGSGQFVYQLDRAGWKLLEQPGAFWAPRAVNLHALAVADCYAQLKHAERGGDVEVIQFTTEPECHVSVGNLLLTPDAYVELGNRERGIKQMYWLEVDRGTEHLGVIQEKCQRYWQAYQMWQGDYFPRVVFVVPDEGRRVAIERCARSLLAEGEGLFEVALLLKSINISVDVASR